jgi:DNA-binding transcriptional MerR regulator
MFSIGDFARHGRVSVRMLRHYDAIGLLPPAHVDLASGYRFYRADQLARLNRILALKELGFTLQQVQSILDEQVGVAELRGMLKLRQAELQAQIAGDTARLARVEARLQTIEREGRQPADVVVKAIPAVRVAELTATAASYAPEAIGPVIQPLYGELVERLARAGLAPTVPDCDRPAGARSAPTGQAIAWYEDAPDGEGAIAVHATLPVPADAEVPDGHDFRVVDLPAIECAATIVHRSAMDHVLPTVQTLARWIEANGYRSAGYARELYVEAPPGRLDRWVTELQEPVTDT